MLKCAACGVELRPGARFCDMCGAKVVTRCPACGAVLRDVARFCDLCGTPLSEGAVAPEATVAQPLVPAACLRGGGCGTAPHRGVAQGRQRPGLWRRPVWSVPGGRVDRYCVRCLWKIPHRGPPV